MITYTTGSSGTPKDANRTHRFLAAQHYALKRLFPYGPNDIDYEDDYHDVLTNLEYHIEPITNSVKSISYFIRGQALD